MIEEQRVIEMNMLDAELLTLREEKNLLADKLCKYENGTPELNEFKQVEEKQKKLLEEAQKERIILGIARYVFLCSIFKNVVFINFKCTNLQITDDLVFIVIAIPEILLQQPTSFYSNFDNLYIY